MDSIMGLFISLVLGVLAGITVAGLLWGRRCMGSIIGLFIGLVLGVLVGITVAGLLCSSKLEDLYSELVDVSNEKRAYEEAYYELSDKVRSVSRWSDENNRDESEMQTCSQH